MGCVCSDLWAAERETEWLSEGAKDQAQIMKRNSNQGSALAPDVHA